MLCTTCRTVYCVTLYDVQLQVTYSRGEYVLVIQLLFFSIRILYRQKISNHIAYVFCFISSTAVLIAIKLYYIAGDILTVLKCIRVTKL